MKKLFAIAILASFTAFAAPLKWTCDWPEAKSQNFSLYQGETATFEPTFRVNGQLVTNATIEAVWYQTNGMGNAWWRLDNATFAPSNDVGAASYRFFVEATALGGTVYRANGSLRMLPSPGFVPNAISPPVVALDFAQIEVSNAPYYTQDETDAKIVELAPAPGNYETVSNKAMTAYVDATNTVLTHVQNNYLPLAWSGYGYLWQLDPIEDSIYYRVSREGNEIARARYGIDNLQLNGDSSAGISTTDWTGFWIGEKEISENSTATFYGHGFIEYADGSHLYEYGFPQKNGTLAMLSDATAAYVDATNNASQLYVKKSGDETINGTFTFKGSGLGAPKTTVNNSGVGAPSVTLSSTWLYQSATLDSGGVTVKSEFYDDPNGERFTYPLGSGGGRFALAGDIDEATNGLLRTESDPTIYPWAKATSKPSYSWSEIASKPSFATVATSGSYSDLSNKPTIPDISGKADESALAAVAQAATNYTDSAIAAIPEPDLSSYAAASDVATNSADIAALKVESSLVYRLYSGSNVVCEVTNYNSAVRSPTMRLLQLDTNGVYTVVWTETNNLHRVAQAATNYTDAAISAATNRFAPRAWSGVTSGLGVDAPPSTTWISTPTTVLAGGFEYQKAVTSAGAVWVLTSNDMTTLGPSANGSYLDIAAADGTSVFRIEKTDSYLVGASADGITVSGNTVTISVPVVASDHPYLRYAASLESPVTWYKEEESDIPGTVSYSWSGSSGAWVCTVTTSNPSGFFYFEFLQQGSTKIVNAGMTDLSGGIWFNGTKYVPTVSGNELKFVAE